MTKVNTNTDQRLLCKRAWVESVLFTTFLNPICVKRSMTLYTNLMYSTLLLITSAQAYNPTWAELKDSSGWTIQDTVQTKVGAVVVKKKLIDGFPCFSGTAKYPEQLNIPLMIEIASDAESAITWSSADITHAKTLSVTNTSVDYWQYLSIPVFSDRMWFLRGYFERDGEAFLFRWEKLENGGPHKEFYKAKIEQFPHAEVTPINLGAWRIQQVENTTFVRYSICSHPGGSISPMFQSIATESTLPNNLVDMIQETKRQMNTGEKP